MIISEQMASSSLFTDMQGSEKRESNLLETPRFRKREEQVVCISDPTCSDRERERERETAEVQLPIGSPMELCHEVTITY